MADNIVSNSLNNFNIQYCTHRLPCGYCQILNRVCPMQGATITPTWTSDPNYIYCNSEAK